MDVGALGRALIDYYYSSQSGWGTSVYIAIAAVVISSVSLLISYLLGRRAQKITLEARAEGVYSHLANIWYDIGDKYMKNPKYLSLDFTEQYYRLDHTDEVTRYEAFCYMAWGFVEDIVAKGFHGDSQFGPTIQWIVAHHSTWLARNPFFFTIPEFWTVVEHAQNAPHAIMRHRVRPRIDDEIDWSAIAKQYFNYNLSPFDPIMIEQKRNPVVEWIKSQEKGALTGLDIIDIGSGPGNLIPHLKDRCAVINCLDMAPEMLRLAEQKGAANGIQVTSWLQNMTEMNVGRQFDVVISVNSILPRERNEVSTILNRVRALMKPDGSFLAILPSFDTAEYLLELWRGHLSTVHSDPAHVERCIRALRTNKRMDHNDLSYADDGVHKQCYHTETSIGRDFEAAGLMIQSMRKVAYPWELTRKFDYGYFPKAQEEIWDWFVVARPAPDAAGP